VIFGVKRCGCGRTYRTPAEWRALPFCRRTARASRSDDGIEVLELRNCPCGSTLAIVVRESRMSRVASRRRLVVYVDPSGRLTARSAGDRSLDASDVWEPLAKVNVPRGQLAVSYIRPAFDALVRAHGWL
jgi:hypothetical protein